LFNLLGLSEYFSDFCPKAEVFCSDLLLLEDTGHQEWLVYGLQIPVRDIGIYMKPEQHDYLKGKSQGKKCPQKTEQAEQQSRTTRSFMTKKNPLKISHLCLLSQTSLKEQVHVLAFLPAD